MKDDKAHFVTYNVHTCNCGWQGDNIRVHFNDVSKARRRSDTVEYNLNLVKYTIVTTNSQMMSISAQSADEALEIFVKRHPHYIPEFIGRTPEPGEARALTKVLSKTKYYASLSNI